ncbi:MAG: hypothetical protein ACOC40_01140 [Thermoplasmatota archaeon]
MEDKLKITGIIILIIMWIVALSGLIPMPSYSWLVLTVITLLVYFVLTRDHSYRKGDMEEVVQDMEDYMEGKAENTEIEFEGVESGEKTADEDKEDKKEKKQKYDFGDDVKIIKE